MKWEESKRWLLVWCECVLVCTFHHANRASLCSSMGWEITSTRVMITTTWGDDRDGVQLLVRERHNHKDGNTISDQTCSDVLYSHPCTSKLVSICDRNDCRQMCRWSKHCSCLSFDERHSLSLSLSVYPFSSCLLLVALMNTLGESLSIRTLLASSLSCQFDLLFPAISLKLFF